MSDDLHQLLSEWFENEQIKREKLLEKYPPDVPNSKCLHAFIKGINIENSFKPSVGDFLPLFETENEKIFVWTYEKDYYSALISKVEPEIKTKPFWKTVGSLLYSPLEFLEKMLLYVRIKIGGNENDKKPV
ncbi:MAG: hypothetical protein PWQ70_3011 [Clostridiales bacterium]|nr:hypothetical protein [Clostridiales bacterium]